MQFRAFRMPVTLCHHNENLQKHYSRMSPKKILCEGDKSKAGQELLINRGPRVRKRQSRPRK